MSENKATYKAVTVRYDVADLFTSVPKGAANEVESLTNLLNEWDQEGWEPVRMTSIIEGGSILYTIVFGKIVNLAIHSQHL